MQQQDSLFKPSLNIEGREIETVVPKRLSRRPKYNDKKKKMESEDIVSQNSK